MKSLPRSATFLLLLFSLAGIAHGEAPPKSGNAAFDRAVEIVLKDFYDPSALPRFEAAAGQAITALTAAGGGEADYGVAIGPVLTALGASHTGHFTGDQLDYYELADIFRYNFHEDLQRLFPPEGKITYPGIGIASAMLDGKRFVTDVYDGGPAAKAGVLAGDEIVSADGAPFAEIGSFRGKVGQSVRLELRRQADAPPLAVDVPVEAVQPSDSFIAAILASARVIERDGKRIGYLHIWFYGRGDVGEAIDKALSSAPLKDADALVVDLRGRWGGAPPDAAETFLGGTPAFRFTGRDGKGVLSNVRWHKPLVAIVDDGTRSGLEVFAYALKAKGITLVGTRTAGALLGGRGYLLPDDSLLELAVAGVELDGHVLEGSGVEPDLSVPFDIRYANGRDPQFDAAVDRAAALMTQG